MENDKAVVVVAEGAAQDLMEAQDERGTDLSGNVLLNDVGPWLCAQLKSKLNEKLDGNQVTLKYIDPSYMVRGLAANAADNIYCTQLAHNAVHGSMAGMTSFLVGPVNTRFCYLPLKLVADKRNVIDAGHRSVWTNVVFDTGQPAFAVDPDVCDLSGLDITTASGGCVLASK
jgi:6-phosphofructokinase 1